MVYPERVVLKIPHISKRIIDKHIEIDIPREANILSPDCLMGNL